MKFFKGPVSCLCHGWLVHLFIMPIRRPYTCKWQKHSFLPNKSISQALYQTLQTKKMNFETLVYKFHLQLCPSVPPIYLADFLKTNLTKFAAEEKKNNGCPLNFYNSYFWPEKNCWTQKVHFGNNVFKNPARTSFKMSSHFEMAQFERLAELFGNI